MNQRRTRLAAALLAAAAILSGCSSSGDPVQPGDGGGTPPPTITWRQVRGGLGVGTVRSIWGTSRDHVYAACDEGVLHYDGSRWSAESGPFPDSLRAVWGTGGVVFAAGRGGTLLARVNGSWDDMSGATGLDIRGLHGRSASDVYAVAATPDTPDAAELLHFDGAMWAHVDTYTGADANAVFAAPGVVYVACDGGVMLRDTGAGLTVDTTPPGDDLLGVWGASATDVHAVGRGGRIIHWDGSAWTPETNPVGADLYAVSGVAANNIMAVGDNGVLLHYDGTAWTTGQLGGTVPLRGACAFGDGHAAAGGSYGSVFSGYITVLAPDYLGEPFTFEGVWAPGPYDVYVAGAAGNTGVIFDGDGDTWYLPDGMRAISGFSANKVFAVGDGGAVYQFDGSGWVKQTTPITTTVRGLTALVTRFGEPFRLYAVGDAGALTVWKAGTWNPVTLPGTEAFDFVDVWAAAIDDVFAVANNATSIVRYDDPYEIADWTIEATPATAPLLTVGGLRGDVYIASEAGEIFFNNGAGWKPVPSPVTTPLRDLRGVSDNSFFAVGDNGVILHGDGTTWRKLNSTFPGKLLGVWGGDHRPLYAVGVDGAVLVHED